MLVPAITASFQPPRGPVAPGVPAVAPPAAPPPSEAELQQTIAAVREKLRPVSNGLEFSVDHGSGKTVVRVVDRETQALIRQIPSEEMVEVARVLERLEGLLFKRVA